MAKGNTVRKGGKGRPSINTSRPRTRGQRPKLHDPVANTAELTAQLRSLGLYAAPTLGDGNCLFRALSDQIYGTPNQHLSLRVEVCEFMASHKDRFEAFVDDDQGLDRHLSAMRSNGTYGGHLELTAFAQLKVVNVKVVQPGLVYVIEGAGTDFFGGARSEPPAGGGGEEGPSTSREKRKARKERKSKKLELDDDDDDEQQAPFPATVYVAYHDWEHFSSVRNLTGPHQGMPNVREVPPPDTLPSPPPSKSNTTTTPSANTTASATKASRMKPKHQQPQPATPDSDSDTPLTPPPPPAPLPPAITQTTVARSPKRAIPDDDDEPSESSSRLKRGRRGTITSAMRTKSRKYVVEKEEDMDDIFSDVLPESGSGSGSGSGVRSVTSVSDAAGSFVSDAPPPPPAPMVEEDLDVDVDGDEEEEEEERSKALTKKQRKSLPATKGKGKAAARASTGSVNAKAAAKAAAGPKSSARAATKPPARARASTGTVPTKGAAKGAVAKGAGEGGSGKRETRSATKVHRDAGRVRDLGTGEWLDNGTGRLDVRGFRELRI